MTHFWRIRKWLPERFEQKCTILKTGRMNSVLVEFADGLKVITNRYYVRRIAP